MTLFSKQKKQLSEDSLWMSRLAHGDSEAFDILYRKYSARIFGFFKSKVQDMDLVFDLNQLTWEKVYKKANLFDPEQVFSSWLYAIASHVMIDEIRKKTRLDKFKGDYQEELSGVNPLDDFVFVENSDNDVFNSSSSTLDGLNFDSLSAQHRTILERRYLEEKSFEQIAREFKFTETNVRKIISRSLKKLKRGYDE